jgi:hypothetical protein
MMRDCTKSTTGKSFPSQKKMRSVLAMISINETKSLKPSAFLVRLMVRY